MKTSASFLAKPTVRTLEEQKSLVDQIYQYGHSHNQAELRDRLENWRYYNDDVDPKEFEYLTKIGENSLPTRYRHIPLQRHLINLLESQQTKRPFPFSVYASDDNSVKSKYYKQITDLVKYLQTKAEFELSNMQQQKQELEGQLQEIQQVISKEPQNQDEAIQIQKLKSQFPIIQNQLSTVINQMSKGIGLKEDEIKEWEFKSKYEKKDIEEELAQDISLKLRQILDIEKKSTKNIRNRFVDGAGYYYVDYIEGHKFPIFENIHPLKVFYPKIDNIDYIQDGPWVALEDSISFEQFETMYRAEFETHYKPEQLVEFERKYGRGAQESGSFAATSTGAIDMNNKGIPNYNYGINSGNQIKRWRVFYKVNQMVRIKKSKNPYEMGKYFRHYIDQEKFLLNLDNYQLVNGFYVNKKDPKDSIHSKKADVYSPAKGDEVIVKYYPIMYEAVVLDGQYKIGFQKKKYVVRNIDNYGILKLPVIGPSFANIGDRPYSLIRSTMNLQKLYNIIHLHQELMLALSGAKGNVIDRSQKPDGMTDSEWEYQRKLGNIQIQTVGQDGRARNVSYNQWQNYDNTLSPSIQFLERIKNQIEDTMGNIIGVPRPRQGQVVGTDQVGTYAQANNQASLITEIIYNDHDQIEGMAMAQLLNLSVRYCFTEETIMNIATSDMGVKTINIPANIFAEKFFDVLVVNSTEELQSIQDIKQMAFRQNEKNLLPFNHLLSIYSTKTLTELTKKVQYFTEKSEKIAQQNQINSIEAQKSAEREKIQFEKEYDMAVKKMEIEVKQLEIEYTRAAKDAELALKGQELSLKEKEIGMRAQSDFAKIESERQVESAYLENQDQHATVDEQIRLLELQMERQQMILNDLRAQEKNNSTNIKSSKPASNTKTKEKIKDK